MNYENEHCVSGEVDLGATKLTVANLTPWGGNSTRINVHFQHTPHLFCESTPGGQSNTS